jgi:hypothetical protein
MRSPLRCAPPTLRMGSRWHYAAISDQPLSINHSKEFIG